ncbi:Tat pathway signal sequence domain protein [Streptomyces tagetis]|uniref:Tat pathway signal sequence domain protein n=1 Tax=Streptomyces tagetis TaxID=2820809 RepID=A0A940XJ87_9ACTN|nr:Tat pathway signal sequence domain protein [Streptomyces sp. RG38]MBQ0827541.1 Tat pathway signal sequence domain protein [Streptomyces sp. RG38]
MRRTLLSAAALACAAVMAATAPALADDTVPGQAPSPTLAPATPAEPTPVPSVSSPDAAEAPAEDAELSAVPEDAQVSAVPEGAPDTGAVARDASGPSAGAAGVGAAALLAAGASVYVVRRRRATGA